MSGSTAFLDPYETLSPVEQLVAQVYGAVCPWNVAPARIGAMLNDAGIRLDKRNISVARINAAVDALLKAGIIQRSTPKREFMAITHWAPWLTLQAFRNCRLDKIMTAFEREQPSYWYYYRSDPAQDEMLLRCRTVTGRLSEIEQHRSEILTHEWRFLAEPGVTELLWKLPKKYLGSALGACLSHVSEEALPPAPVLEACYSLSPDISLHLADIAFIHVLQGELDKALAIFDDTQRSSPAGKRLKIDRAATGALIAMLRGHDEEAIELINLAIAEEKAGTRKRIVFPTARAFMLSLLSLARHDTPANVAMLEQLLGIAFRRSIHPDIALVVATAARLQFDQQDYYPEIDDPSIYLLLNGFTCCWKNKHPRFKRGGTRDLLSRFAERALANGFDWVAAECLEVIRRAKRTKPGKHLEVLDKRAAEIHARLGTVTLASLVRPLPEWEYPLKQIERFAFSVNRDRLKSTRGEARAARPRRLVWNLEFDDLGGVAVTPCEQRGNKNGTWSKGQTVSLKRLLSERDKMDFLLEQDHAAALTIKQDNFGRQGYVELYLPPAGMYALAGHPYVFNSTGGSVDIVQREPELLMDESDNGLVATRLEPFPENADGSDYHVQMVGSNRCEVTRFTSSQKKLLEVLPPEGITLPEAAKKRLLEAVSDLAGVVRVQGVIDDSAGALKQLDADSQPWVKLAPKGHGLVVELVVEPVSGSGIHFQPGRGGTTVFSRQDNETVQARRDLKAELSAVEGLVTPCPILAPLNDGCQSLVLPEPEDCLELLEYLDATGIRCLWPEHEPYKIVARLDTTALRLSIKSAEDWFRASGELEVDAQKVLDLRELFELMDKSRAGRFLELGDGNFVSLTASFRRQLDDLRSLSAPSGQDSIRLHPLTAPALQDFFEETQFSAAAAWHEQCDRLQAAQAFEPELPSTLQAELRPYQLEGFHWLARLGHWGVGACLADDMGLGKTVQALALLLQRASNGPALVVAPTSVVANWSNETHRFAPTLNVIPYTAGSATRAKLLESLNPFDLIITTYNVLQIDIDRLAQVKWDTVVLDEAQAIKNPATKRARAARKLNASFRLVTTGTPVQNNLVDLYSLFGFLNPGMLGSMQQYRRNFAQPIERDADAEARARLRRLVAPFVLRRLKTEVLNDLPPRTEIVLHVQMSPAETAFYEALRQRAVADIESLTQEKTVDSEHRLQILAHLTRLRLACCNPRLVQETGAPPSSKLQVFSETLAELLSNRHKVLVFSQFVMHLKLVEEYLVEAGISYQYLDGATSAKARAARISAFQAGEGNVFLISLKAGGIGLNLTAADYVIHMDPWWNPAVEDQASDRAHRIGQTRPVTIYRLVTRETIEEQIVELHHHKRELAERLLEGANTPARLNAGELLELLRQPPA